MANFGYQFTGFEHGHVELYTRKSSSDSYTKLVGTYYPTDNEVHNLSLNILPYDNNIKIKYIADDGYYWKAGSKAYYGGGDSYVDVYEIPITKDTTATPKSGQLDAGLSAFYPLKFTAQSSPVSKAGSAFNITQNLSHCTSDFSNKLITPGEHTITLTASDSYYFQCYW